MRPCSIRLSRAALQERRRARQARAPSVNMRSVCNPVRRNPEMFHSTFAANGMVVAPHHLAAEAGLSVLREGGNAIEAMVPAAAAIAVVLPPQSAERRLGNK